MLSSNLDENSMVAACLVLGGAGVLVAMDLFGGDLDRAERKRFGRALDALEVRILNHQANGVSLDQASSLCRNASDVGYKDPELGFSILSQAEEDIERTLALAEDITEIRQVCADSVEQAAEIAPLEELPFEMNLDRVGSASRN